MIGQYLSNTNERATVFILQNILELIKASKRGRERGREAPALVAELARGDRGFSGGGSYQKQWRLGDGVVSE